MNSAAVIDPPVSPMNPWWPLPLALLLWMLMLWGFGSFFAAPDKVMSTPPNPIDARIVELPPPPAPPKIQPKPIVKTEKVSHPAPLRPTPQPTQVTQPAPKVALPPAPALPATHVDPVPPPPPPKPEPSPGPDQGGTQQMGARALYQPKPVLPEDLRDETIHTVVMARFHIKPDGSATVELIQPAPDPRVNQFLLKTLKTWRFFPAIQGGKPVASVLDVKYPIDVE